MTRNTQTNCWIKRFVILGDFLLLNLVLYAFSQWRQGMMDWSVNLLKMFSLVANLALIISEWKGHTIIHRRLVSAGDILKRVTQLILIDVVLTYLILRGVGFNSRVGYLVMDIGAVLMLSMILLRFIERTIIKWYRQSGGNIRSITLVGDDPELANIKKKLMTNPTLGYRVAGEYKDVDEFIQQVSENKQLDMGDELYLCVTHREKDKIKRISHLCDQRLVNFFYIPISVECLGINLRREMLDDIDIYTLYEQPLQIPVNRLIKRFCDVVISLFFVVIAVSLFLPIIWVMIKIQSPGPLLFKQQRTGLDGKTFTLYKFRSMHVNAKADEQQCSRNDPRKFKFGCLMRKLSIDEVPQLWNVLKGDMSIIGPRPHMLAHTDEYSHLIDKYMVRHFVKPGITGWAQVTGFRGETKELWQMEERVKRDIWYMENWSFWLDIRILWLTLKAMLVRNENAY